MRKILLLTIAVLTGISSVLAKPLVHMSDIMEKDEAEITIKWLSHKNSNYTLLETEERSTVANWKRVGFEHKTNSLKMISGYNIR
jgi:hypothetical protein